MRRLTAYLLALTVAAAPILPPTSPGQAVAAATADARKIPSRDRYFTRYFYVPETGKDRTTLRAAFKLHLNLLSRESAIADVVEVTPFLWRIDIRDVGWSPATLEAARDIDPFFHEVQRIRKDTRADIYWPGGVDRKRGRYFSRGLYSERLKIGDRFAVAAPWLPTRDVLALRHLLYSEVPVLHAGWFLVQSARQLSLRNKDTGLGYYSLLRLKDRNDYFRLIGLDEKASIRVQREMRAALEFSGVSPGNRQVVRLGAASGGVYVTLDTSDQSGRGVAIRNLLRGEFRHQAEEIYGFLPNNLPATFLSNDKGVKQSFAPADQFGFKDDSVLNESRDGRIHINLSCVSCHAGQVLQPLEDYIRRSYKDAVGLGSKKREVVLELRRTYFSDLNRQLARDRSEYVEAFRLATTTTDHPLGLTAQQAAEAYVRTWHAYGTRPVTRQAAARELGVTEAHLKAALDFFLTKYKILDVGLAPFAREPPLPISRLTFEDSYSRFQDTIRGYVPRKP